MKVNTINTAFKITNWFHWPIPLLLVATIKCFSLFPFWVETIYSIQIFPYISLFQRRITSLLPFSIGDCIYTIILLKALLSLIIFFKKLFQRQINLAYLKSMLQTFIIFLLWIYIIFYCLWGLNYNRLGIAAQLHLPETSTSTEKKIIYSDAELKNFVCDIAFELDNARKELGDSNYEYPNNKELFNRTFLAYHNAESNFPFLHYGNHPAIKPSLLSSVVSYAGYSGYYNPFSGEAQVNTDLPKFYMPYVTLHEMAHQIGYASESEASFVAYLVAMHSHDPLLRYSALFDLFATANAELFERDFWSAILNIKTLSPLVSKDRKTYREYILGKQNNVEPVLRTVYDQYLKANQQQSGINSYNELVGWVIAYRKGFNG